MQRKGGCQPHGPSTRDSVLGKVSGQRLCQGPLPGPMLERALLLTPYSRLSFPEVCHLQAALMHSQVGFCVLITQGPACRGHPDLKVQRASRRLRNNQEKNSGDHQGP